MLYKLLIYGLLFSIHLAQGAILIPQSSIVINHLDLMEALEQRDYIEVQDLLDDISLSVSAHRKGDISFIVTSLVDLLDSEGVEYFLDTTNYSNQYVLDRNKINISALRFLFSQFSTRYLLDNITSADYKHWKPVQVELVKEFYQKRADILKILVESNDLALNKIRFHGNKIANVAAYFDDSALLSLIFQYDKKFIVDKQMMQIALARRSYNVLKVILPLYKGKISEFKNMVLPFDIVPQPEIRFAYSNSVFQDDSLLVWSDWGISKVDRVNLVAGEDIRTPCKLPYIYQCIKQDSLDHSGERIFHRWNASSPTGAEVLKLIDPYL